MIARSNENFNNNKISPVADPLDLGELHFKRFKFITAEREFSGQQIFSETGRSRN